MGLSASHALVPVEAVLIIKPLTAGAAIGDLDFEDRFFADLGLVGAKIRTSTVAPERSWSRNRGS